MDLRVITGIPTLRAYIRVFKLFWVLGQETGLLEVWVFVLALGRSGLTFLLTSLEDFFCCSICGSSGPKFSLEVGLMIEDLHAALEKAHCCIHPQSS